ncbi:hypothetical protein pipiens_000456, partial [Culex pipiens pipiens]
MVDRGVECVKVVKDAERERAALSASGISPESRTCPTQ